MRRLIAGVALAAAGALLVPSAAMAANIDVDTVADEYGTGAGCSLREAVQAANDDVAFGGCTAGSGPADAIMLDPGAVYTLGLPGAGEDANATGDLDLETGSGDLSLARDGAGPRPTIDAGDLDGALDVTGGGSLALGSIRVIGGLRSGSDPDLDRGGALRWGEPLVAGELTVDDSLFEGNDAAQASAIDANTTGAHTITDSVVSGGFAFDLGAVFAAGPLTVTRSTIRDNLGGGVVADNPGPASLIIDSSAIADNRFGTGESRGGVYAAGDATIENSTVTGNSGGFVGGVWPEGALTVRFSTIAANVGVPAAGHSAGGIDVQSSDGVVLDGVVLAGNRLGNNPAPSNCNQQAGITEGPNPNLEDADSCGLDAGPGQASLINADPLLAPLADNGGPTPTRALYEGSPAIDAALAACSEPFDQRGTARPVGAACDIGAFEGSVAAPPPPPPPALTQPSVPVAKKKKGCRKGFKLIKIKKKGKKAKQKCVRVKKKKKCKKGGATGGSKCKGKKLRAASLAGGKRLVIGRSARGLPIVATRLGDPDAQRVALVVGVIHGDERAGLGVTRLLRRRGPVEGLGLWVIDNLNPDGSRRRSRRNARGVDLNRNFPHRWRGRVPPSSGYYPGRSPASEPETRAAIKLIERIEPDLSIWYHQPWGAVLACRGRPAAAARYARLAGTGTSCRGRGLPGTAINWERATIPGATAFVVELAAGRLSGRAARRHARAAIAVAAGGGA